MNSLSQFAAKKPRFCFSAIGLAVFALLILVLIPTFYKPAAQLLHPLIIDTDPENMLPADEPIRVFHNEMKERFALHDFIVVGVVNDARPEGIFTPESLRDIHTLAGLAQETNWQDDAGSPHGVVRVDVIAPSLVDNIEQDGLGAVRFEWLMKDPPATAAQALAVGEKARRIPLYDNTLVSEDGTSIALYLPIYEKSDSYRVAQILRAQIATLSSGDTYYITGLPVAQDQFGIEMFIQMAISAPMAMLLIFALMWYFFRHMQLIVAPLLVAMASVMLTMGLLIVSGNTVHIMSSMIPIFIMPIAVLDAVHVLSEFHDRYRRLWDPYETLRQVMVTLWKPMLFTSLTTAVGFASLALADIPPVQVFGLFVAIGVMLAWLMTMILVPAYIMSMSRESLAKFGSDHENNQLGKVLPRLGAASYRSARAILLATLALYAVGAYGITQIHVNDNPVKWFEPNHSIRVADRALNEAFGGTYMAYIALDAGEAEPVNVTEADLASLTPAVRESLTPILAQGLEALRQTAQSRREAATADEDFYAWDDALLVLDRAAQSNEVFKQPEVLRWMSALQEHLQKTGHVGKSNGLPEIVKTVHRELQLGEDSAYRIPDTRDAVAQTLITFQSSHRPNDLWHFVTNDYRSASLWLQLKSGDNTDMQSVVDSVKGFVARNPPPVALNHEWFGLTYINVVWQQKMVYGMLMAFASSFIVVLLMLTFLFRSLLWGLMAMVPLTMSIGLVYGLLGFIGKDYDMPIAVLSSLSLGLAIDYAIHFISRSREIRARHPDWRSALDEVFGEPARAIFRNVIVVGVGFMPLLLAPLTPYQTVGMFISLILFISGVASLVILPALITLFKRFLFDTETEESKLKAVTS